MVKRRSTLEKELKLLNAKINIPKMFFGHFTILPKDILIDKRHINHLDAYIGQIHYFNWLKAEHPTGAGLAPILYLLEQCKKKYNDKRVFNLLKRKTTYIKLLNEELEYLSKRYIWKKLPGCFEIFISKFENFITMSCEILLVLINLYELKKLKRKYPKFNKFESLIKDLENEDISQYFKSINHYLYMSLLVYIRNKIVHNPRHIKYTKLKSQNPHISLKNINEKHIQRLHDVVQDYFKLYCKGKKITGMIVSVPDLRFKGFFYRFKLNKKHNVDIDNLIISYESDLLSLAKEINGKIFLIERDVLNSMIK